MSINTKIMEAGLVKYIQDSGWSIFEDEPEDTLWSISASKGTSTVCITQETRLLALQCFAAREIEVDSGLIINFKRLHPDAILPVHSHPGDAGADVVAVDMRVTPDFIEYDLGFSIAVPEGHMALLFPRSSISKIDLALANSVGVIDSGYRGPMLARFIVTGSGDKRYAIGDRVAQLVIVPIPFVRYQEVQDLDATERGAGGYGSTGV